MNLNKVLIAGNLTRDPEIKYTSKGTAVCQIGVAVNHTFKVGDERREETTFIDVEAFGKTAEVIGEHFKKGKPIFVEGRLKLEVWDDKASGNKRSKMKVICENFQFIGGGEKSAPNERQQAPASRKPSSAPRPPADPDLDPKDLPF